MSHVDTPWTRLASRTARGVLSRKGVTYEELLVCLQSVGVDETLKGIVGKIQRGGFKCGFFLQLLCALEADLPPELQHIIDHRESWEDACTQIAAHTLAVHSLTVNQLEKRFSKHGIALSREHIEQQFSTGAFPFTLLLQLSLIAPIAGLERVVDASDIAKAAREAALPMK